MTLTAIIRRNRYGVAIALGAIALLGFEYYNGVAPAYTFEATAYSTWIAKQPPGIVANHPLPTDSALALRLLALTALRPGELRYGRWIEIEGLDGPEPV